MQYLSNVPCTERVIPIARKSQDTVDCSILLAEGGNYGGARFSLQLQTTAASGILSSSLLPEGSAALAPDAQPSALQGTKVA